jgi:transposase
MRKERKHYTGEEKVAILKRHLLDKVPVSDLCEQYGLQPTVLYRWLKELFENGAAAFQGKDRPDHQGEQQLAPWEKRAISDFHIDVVLLRLRHRLAWSRVGAARHSKVGKDFENFRAASALLVKSLANWEKTAISISNMAKLKKNMDR